MIYDLTTVENDNDTVLCIQYAVSVSVSEQKSIKPDD